MQTVYSVVIFSHRFLDSDRINFKTFAFMAVTLLNIIIQHRHQSLPIFFSSILHNVKQCL